jgi:hypothetical protein
MLGVPRVIEAAFIPAAVTLAEKVKAPVKFTLLFTVVTVKTFAVKGEVTVKVFETVIAALALIAVELAIKTLAEVLALMATVLPLVTTMAAPPVLPVDKVRLVVPLAVLIEVVVSDDIRL